MTYEQLDTIADAYIPLLGIMLLALMTRKLISRDYKASSYLGLQTLLALVIVYGLMTIDNTFQIWPILSLDYSTHTALSLVLVMILVNHFTEQSTLKTSLVLSFLAYCGLMLYQKYHTLTDIISTALVIAPLLYIIQIKLLNKQSISRKKLPPSNS